MALKISQPLIEKIKTWIAVKIFWRKEDNFLNSIVSFSSTEADGVWHLHRTLSSGVIKCSKQRALLFAQIIEETHHADVFRKIYNEYTNLPFVPQHFERMDIYKDKDAIKTLHYVHVGEDDATTRFYLISKYLDKKHKSLIRALKKILVDEEKHIHLSDNLLLDLGLSKKELKKTYASIRLRRRWENWLRIGKNVVNHFSNIILSLIYFLVIPFFYIFAKRKLANRFTIYFSNKYIKA